MPSSSRIRAAAKAAWAAFRGGGAAHESSEGGAKGAATTTSQEKATGPGSPPANPFQAANDQFLSSIKWLVGALSAIAALLLAGTQLSDVGQLAWPEDRARLIASGVAFTLVLVFVVVALGLLAFVQMPGPGSDLDRLRKIVERQEPKELLLAVQDDSSYHRGANDLPHLLKAADDASKEYYKTRAAAAVARSRAVRTVGPAKATPAEAAKSAQELAKAAKSAQELADIASEEYAGYRRGVRLTSQLDGHLQIGRRAAWVTWVVLSLTLLSALSLVVFVWAANPPESPTAEAALAPRPVAAHLRLDSADTVWADRLGPGCAAAARKGQGVPVVALSAADGSVEVLVLQGGACQEPVQVVIPTDAGTVRPDTRVAPSD